MKTFILLILLSLGLSFSSCEKKSSDSTKSDTTAVIKQEDLKSNEEPITFLKSLNKTDILTKFFNPYKIINDTALWKQDLEAIDMKVSADGYIHTTIDTIFDLGNSYLIIFSTYEVLANGEAHECHPCNVDYSIANVVKEDNHFKVNSFKKYLTSKGSMGYGGYLTIVKFTNNLICLKFEDGWIGGGTMMAATEYFNVEDFSSLIYLETHNSNEGMCDETDFKCIDKTERELIPFDKHPSKNPAIIITYKRTYFDKKLIIIEKSDTLIYDGYHFNKDVYYEGV